MGFQQTHTHTHSLFSADFQSKNKNTVTQKLFMLAVSTRTQLSSALLFSDCCADFWLLFSIPVTISPGARGGVRGWCSLSLLTYTCTHTHAIYGCSAFCLCAFRLVLLCSGCSSLLLFFLPSTEFLIHSRGINHTHTHTSTVTRPFTHKHNSRLGPQSLLRFRNQKS